MSTRRRATRVLALAASTLLELRYMPLAHPWLLPQPGTVVVSYSRNFVDLDQVCAVPSRYRPNFLRVVLPR